jgi:Flp pilus assembly protein TadG
MATRRRRRLRGDRGAAAVEFALVLIPLFLVISGIIDFGRAYNTQETLTQAARVGARLASLGKSDAVVCAQTANAAKSVDSSIDCSDVRVSNQCDATGEATVRIDYTVDFWMLSAFLPNRISSVSVQGKATAPC